MEAGLFNYFALDIGFAVCYFRTMNVEMILRELEAAEQHLAKLRRQLERNEIGEKEFLIMASHLLTHIYRSVNLRNVASNKWNEDADADRPPVFSQ